MNLDMRFLVIDVDELVFSDVELFQSKRVFRIVDFSDEVWHVHFETS